MYISKLKKDISTIDYNSNFLEKILQFEDNTKFEKIKTSGALLNLKFFIGKGKKLVFQFPTEKNNFLPLSLKKITVSKKYNKVGQYLVVALPCLDLSDKKRTMSYSEIYVDGFMEMKIKDIKLKISYSENWYNNCYYIQSFPWWWEVLVSVDKKTFVYVQKDKVLILWEHWALLVNTPSNLNTIDFNLSEFVKTSIENTSVWQFNCGKILKTSKRKKIDFMLHKTSSFNIENMRWKKKDYIFENENINNFIQNHYIVKKINSGTDGIKILVALDKNWNDEAIFINRFFCKKRKRLLIENIEYISKVEWIRFQSFPIVLQSSNIWYITRNNIFSSHGNCVLNNSLGKNCLTISN